MKPDHEAKRAIEEWTGHRPEVSVWGILWLMVGGFVGIVLLGIGASFWVGVFFDAPPPARAELDREPEPVYENRPITREEIEGRNRHGRVVDER